MKKYIEKALTQWQWFPKQIQERASKKNVDLGSHKNLFFLSSEAFYNYFCNENDI